MRIVGNGVQAVARAAVVTAAMTALSGVAWAQFSSGPSGSGPHTGTSGTTAPSQMTPSGAGQGAASCAPNAAACGGSSGGSGSSGAGSGDVGAGQSVSDFQVRPRNDKIPSRRTDD